MNPDAKGKNCHLREACRWLLGPPTLQAESRTRYDPALNQPDVGVRGNLVISDTDRRHNHRGDLLRRLQQPQ